MLLRMLELLSAISLVAAVALPFLSDQSFVAVGVWVASIGAWIVLAKLRPHHEPPGIVGVIPLIPVAFLLQYFVDRWIPMLGSAVILVVNIGGVVRELRQRPLPVAVIRSRR